MMIAWHSSRRRGGILGITFEWWLPDTAAIERTAFQETSTFEKVGGAWLYKEGVIGDPPGREPKEVDEETIVEEEAPATVASGSDQE